MREYRWLLTVEIDKWGVSRCKATVINVEVSVVNVSWRQVH